MSTMSKQNELKIFLKVKGIYISPSDIRVVVYQIQSTIARTMKRIGHFPHISGGNHAFDVALFKVLSRRIGAREGLDWGWGLSLDNYHFDIGLNFTVKAKRLSDMVMDYNIAVMRASLPSRSDDVNISEEVW